MIAMYAMRIFADCQSCFVLLLLLLPATPRRRSRLLEQKAVIAAVERVAPSVVRIETVGGLERVEGVAFGTGPTTGWIVDPQGYIISSAFNFSNQPSSILVRLPDGTRKPAKLVATDHSRMIVLLKVETSTSRCRFAKSRRRRKCASARR